MGKPDRIHFACPECGSRVRAPVELAGRRAKCVKCGTKVRVPARNGPEQTQLDAERAESQAPEIAESFPPGATVAEPLSLDDPAPESTPTVAKDKSTRHRCDSCGIDDDVFLECAPLVVESRILGCGVVAPAICARCARRRMTQWMPLVCASLAFVSILLGIWAMALFATGRIPGGLVIGGLAAIVALPFVLMLIRYLNYRKMESRSPEELIGRAIAKKVEKRISPTFFSDLQERLERSRSEALARLFPIGRIPSKEARRAAVDGVRHLNEIVDAAMKLQHMKNMTLQLWPGPKGKRMAAEIPDSVNISTFGVPGEPIPFRLRGLDDWLNFLTVNLGYMSRTDVSAYLVKVKLLDAVLFDLTPFFILQSQHTEPRVREGAATVLGRVTEQLAILIAKSELPPVISAVLPKLKQSIISVLVALDVLEQDAAEPVRGVSAKYAGKIRQHSNQTECGSKGPALKPARGLFAGFSDEEKRDLSTRNVLMLEAEKSKRQGGNVQVLGERHGLVERLSDEELNRLIEIRKLMMKGDATKGAEAISQYKQVATLAPWDDICLMSIGVEYANAGNFGEAIRWLEKALALNPSNARIRNNLEGVKDAARSER